MIDLAGMTAVVTGAARRIGAETARALAEAGCDIVINYRHSADDAAATARTIAALDRRVLTVQGDMSKRADAQRLLSETLAGLGHVDILVANASVFRRTPIADVDEDAWSEMIDNNLAATFWPLQAFGVHMRAGNGGSIAVLADVAAYRSWAEYAPYNAAKAGVVALTQTLAKELAPKVRVNAIAPGPMIFPEHYDEAKRQQEIARTLLKRPGNPRHIADAIVALARNDYITGAVLPVDGGRGLA